MISLEVVEHICAPGIKRKGSTNLHELLWHVEELADRRIPVAEALSFFVSPVRADFLSTLILPGGLAPYGAVEARSLAGQRLNQPNEAARSNTGGPALRHPGGWGRPPGLRYPQMGVAKDSCSRGALAALGGAVLVRRGAALR